MRHIPDYGRLDGDEPRFGRSLCSISLGSVNDAPAAPPIRAVNISVPDGATRNIVEVLLTAGTAISVWAHFVIVYADTTSESFAALVDVDAAGTVSPSPAIHGPTGTGAGSTLVATVAAGVLKLQIANASGLGAAVSASVDVIAVTGSFS